ncbi:MAG TPA: phosphate ABC transporter permease PstA [Candidatus Aminicenantes bacterium]|nr:phosphate ABC transporter permease PstA [Candidatus Aminicenantes bacterium]
MDLRTRKLFDRSLTGVSVMAVALMALALAILLAPIVARGLGAFFFRATSEFRRFNLEQFDRGDPRAVAAETRAVAAARRPVYDMLAAFEDELAELDTSRRPALRKQLREVKEGLVELLGPPPGEIAAVMLRQQYGQTRWDRARGKLAGILFAVKWDYSDPSRMGRKVLVPRRSAFAGTRLEPLFPYLERNLKAMLRPRPVFYWRFLADRSLDSHFFGGIWPEILGTVYLTLGAMLLAIPFGVIAAVYLSEFAAAGRVVSLLRVCISTLAGVPSIVFGLFGLAFFINTLHLSRSKSVLAGSATLALLILPTIIRASEEALKAVPRSYKEAALSLGASPLRMVLTVLLPAALPGILTGIIISMGRAAGETAPIIFTAAVSVGQPLKLWETLSQPTPALPWNIYNLATEHQAVDEIRHVQFGMVLTLVLLVLLLNLAAILIRARISKKMRG